MLAGDSSTTIPSSGKTSARAECTVEELSGSLGRQLLRARRSAPAPGARTRGTASSSAARLSPTSATIASPIGARAASSGSLVIATSSAPSGSSGPGMWG